MEVTFVAESGRALAGSIASRRTIGILEASRGENEQVIEFCIPAALPRTSQ